MLQIENVRIRIVASCGFGIDACGGWAAGLGAVACGSTKPLYRRAVAMANGCGCNGVALRDTMRGTRHVGHTP